MTLKELEWFATRMKSGQRILFDWEETILNGVPDSTLEIFERAIEAREKGVPMRPSEVERRTQELERIVSENGLRHSTPRDSTYCMENNCHILWKP